MPVPEIAEAIGRHLNLPARSLPAEEFGGVLVPLLSTDVPASSAITQEQCCRALITSRPNASRVSLAAVPVTVGCQAFRGG